MLLFLLAGLRVRLLPCAASAVMFGVALLAVVSHASAHEGHDHEPAATPMPVTVSPRAVATGDEFEAVAILKSGELVIFVDRFADNTPVTTATVAVTVGTLELKVPSAADGTYRVAWPAVAKSGRHDVVINIQDGATADLLIATLEVPQLASTPAAGTTAGLTSRVQRWFGRLPIMSGLGALALFALAAFLVRIRNSTKRSFKTSAKTDRKSVV